TSLRGQGRLRADRAARQQQPGAAPGVDFAARVPQGSPRRRPQDLRRLGAPPVLHQPLRDADEQAQRVDGDHARQPPGADRPGDQVLREEADLDHGVRLADEAARPLHRRLVVEAGELPDRGVRDRPEEPAHPAHALVPAPRRAERRRLAVGPRDDVRPEEAVVYGVPEAAALTPGGRVDRPRDGGEELWFYCGGPLASVTVVVWAAPVWSM